MKNIYYLFFAFCLLSGAEWGYQKTITSEVTQTGIQHYREANSPDVGQALAYVEQSEYFISYQETVDALQSPNRSVNMRFTYLPDGFSAKPRVDSAEQWNIAFNLEGIYRGEEIILPAGGEAAKKLSGNHLLFEQDGFAIEYLNGKDGMRQNFLVAKKPAGIAPLTVKMRVKAENLLLACKGNELIGTQDGIARYYYKDLKVYDANGQVIDAGMQLQGDELLLVVNDQNAIYPLTIDPLSTTAAARLESNQESALMGNAVSSAGDVNGDGYSDIIVGARYFDNGESEEGAAFVYHGSAGGIATTPAVMLEGNQASGQMGWSVASAGDINNDGYSDIIVGAVNFNAGEAFEGAAFVYHGGPGGISTTFAVRLESNVANDQLGWSVASAGDVNGDGYSDVIVGVPFYDNGQNNEGAAFVYHGSAAGLNPTVAAKVESNQVSAWLGQSVASAGDVNGDGYSDVVAGADAYDNGQDFEGAFFVYHGSATGISTTAAVMVEGNQVYAGMGVSVAGAGDVNGDGYGDVIVGAYGYANGQTNEGAAFVYHGSAAGIGTTEAARLEPNQTWARMGISVASAGDVNGDGYSDVIVGAYSYEISRNSDGAAFVFNGGPGGLSTTSPVILGADQRISDMGESVASAGDVNGDGYSDVIAGAPRYDNGQMDEGAAFVFHGSPDCTLVTWYKDTDNDGYSDGTTLIKCNQPTGYKPASGLTAISGDCNDGNAIVYPGATELCDGLNNDCDGETDENAPPAISPATTNNALHFDGVDDHVALINSCGTATPIVNGGDEITIEYWFKGSVLQSAVRLQPDGDNYIVSGHFGEHILSNDGGWFAGSGVPVGAAATDGNWHHVAMTWKRNTVNGFKSYLDGQLAGQRNSSNNPLPVINSGAFLGALFGNLQMMTGTLDDVRIWSIARTQEQLQSGLCSITLPQTGLVARYTFDNGTANGDNTGVLPGVQNMAQPGYYNGRITNFALNGTASNWVSSPANIVWYRDADGDGFGDATVTTQSCTAPTGYVSNNTDCNDNSAMEKPGQVWYKDSDNDGYGETGAGTLSQCLRPTGYKVSTELTATTGDCSDGNATVYPGAPELCDGLDNNCNSKIDDLLFVSAPTHSQNGTTGNWTVPAGGPYKVQIAAKGAMGGNGISGLGGSGASMKGTFILASGQVVQVIAGSPGSTNYSGSGGAGSGAQLNNGTLLLVAGGGGGTGPGGTGGGGVITSGNGNGGLSFGVMSSSGGGGGYLSPGQNGSNGQSGGGGQGYNALGGTGSQPGGGGFGGGGAAGGGSYGGGGGGGYSGGNGSVTSGGPGSGGSSYNFGTNQTNSAASNNGGGEVTIECLGNATVSAAVTPVQPDCSNPAQGSLNIDLTGDLDGNTNGLEYAIVSGNSFSGSPTYADITADPFNIATGFGTSSGTYTVRIRVKYNPDLFFDNTYTILSLSSGTIYVNQAATGANNGTSWADAYTDLQSALSNACSGAQIWVAAGTYKPSAYPAGCTGCATDRDFTFQLRDGVSLYGGFAGNENLLSQRNIAANTTTLSGDIGTAGNALDNVYHVVLAAFASTTPNTRLDGFAIHGGNADGDGQVDVNGQSIPQSNGGGMYITQGANTVTNNRISANQATNGGGIHINGGINTLVGNSLSGNYARLVAGGIYIFDGTNTLTNNSLSGNDGPKLTGGIYTNGGTIDLVNNILWGNNEEIFRNGGSLSVTYSIVQGGYTGTGNLDVDPLFISTSDLRLQACSPAIDAGTNSGAPATDLDGLGRVDAIAGGGTVDMGAYEYQQTVVLSTWYTDADGDSYGTGTGQQFCANPGTGWANRAGDCNDGNGAINPGATEVCSNGIDDNCNGTIDEGSVLTTPGPITGPVGVCRGATGQVFSVAPVPGATSYQWILPTGATGSSTTNSITLNFSSTYNMGLIAVKAIGSCNQSALSARQIQAYTSKPGQPKNITGKNLGTCVGNEIYSIPAVANATGYNWVAPANTTIVNGQGTTSIELSFASGFVSGILAVTASNCMGTSTARTLQLLTKPGTPAAIVGPASVCPGAVGIKFSTTGLAGVTYNWQVPSGATITNGQGTAAISVNWGTAAGNVRVSAGNVCGVSAFRSLAVGLASCITIAMAEELQAEPAENKLDINLWPNPARDVLMVTLNEFVPNQKMELSLIQADGKVQTAQSLMPTVKGQQVRMDVSRSAAGYYILLVKQQGMMISKQVLIIR